LVTLEHDAEAGELRTLAQDVANRLENPHGAAVVLASGRGGKALVVAACTANLQDRGVTAPLLLEPAGEIVGGSSGGKPGLAFSGGPRGDATDRALDAIEPRLLSLLGAR
jgi:alanyl-tRNA synthetase